MIKPDMYWCLMLFLVYILIDYRPCSASTFNQTMDLYKHLRAQSHKSVRPVENQNQTIAVDVTIFLRGILSLDERNQRLTTACVFGLRWYRDMTLWDKHIFGGVTETLFEPTDVWIPELGIINSLHSNMEIPKHSSMKVTLQFDGLTSWNTGTNLVTTCSINVSKYPFDLQHCEFIVAVINGLKDDNIHLRSTSKTVDLLLYDVNDTWELLETAVVEKVHYGSTRLHVKISMKRRYLYSVLSIILPLFIISFMNVLSFKIPPKSGERISYGVSLFLTFAVLLTVFSESIPQVSTSLSVLQVYINIQVACSLIITTLSIGFVRLAQSTNSEDMPRLLLRFYKILGHQTNKKHTVNSKIVMNARVAMQFEDKNHMTNDKRCDPKEDDNIGVYSLNVEDVISHFDNICFLIFLGIYVTVSILCLFGMLVK